MTKTRQEIENDDNALPQQQIAWANIAEQEKSRSINILRKPLELCDLCLPHPTRSQQKRQRRSAEEIRFICIYDLTDVRFKSSNSLGLRLWTPGVRIGKKCGRSRRRTHLEYTTVFGSNKRNKTMKRYNERNNVPSNCTRGCCLLERIS